MIKALWFAIKVGVLIALVVWLADQPGTVKLEFLDYVITVHMGLFLVAVLVVNLLAIFSYQIVRAFVTFPESLRRYNEIKDRERGYRALTVGLSAVAAGDTKVAVTQARRAKKFLPEDRGLPVLLDAQAARLDGREDDAVHGFAAMLESKDAAFLGVRGLLQSAMDMGDYETARELSERALALHPKQPWILKIAYGLQVRARDWVAARGVLKRMEKVGAMDAAAARSDRAAMLMVEADDALAAGRRDVAVKSWNAAKREAKDFAPAVLALCGYYQGQGQGAKARGVLEKAWKAAPHDAYVAVWAGLMPAGAQDDALARLKHIARLVKLNASSARAYREVGRAAMDAALWGEAKDYFEKADAIEPSAELYRLWASLEERSAHDDEAAKLWLEKATHAPDDRGWVCRDTGRVFDGWMAFVPPDSAFNSLEWAPVGGSVDYSGLIKGAVDDQRGVLEAPAA
jgi:HemY protein